MFVGWQTIILKTISQIAQHNELLINETAYTLEFIMDIIRLIFAVILPPLGVFLQVGFGKHFWINIILTLLGFLPGIIHAVWIIAKK